MFNLHIIQAAYGDCLLLEYGTNAKRYILIDGGPPDTFRIHLHPVLTQIVNSGGALDLVVLSHVDTDHVTGLLDYLSELRTANHGLPVPQGLWHNTFTATVDPNGVIQPRLAGLITPTRANIMSVSGLAVQGIKEGANLRTIALALPIPINKGFSGNLISVDNAMGSRTFGSLEIRIVGPTQVNLNELENEWIGWLNTHENSILSNDPFVMANSDRSVPNLSSIMFLAKADSRTMLFTGDGRSDHLLTGLSQAGLLNANGQMHVNVLKLPHHGSNRNVTRTFFRKITADIYVASANGRDGNPDLATLIWIIEAAKDQQRQIEIVFTNRTPSVEKLIEEYPQNQYGYSIQVLAADQHVISV
jgi:hypothetical protein